MFFNYNYTKKELQKLDKSNIEVQTIYISFFLYIIKPANVHTNNIINEGHFNTAGDSGHNNNNMKHTETTNESKHNSLSHFLTEYV